MRLSWGDLSPIQKIQSALDAWASADFYIPTDIEGDRITMLIGGNSFIVTVKEAIMSQPALAWVDVPDSANIARVFYHEPTQTICVQFHSGGLYSYLGAPEEIYMGLVHAPSVGKYLHNVIKAFPYTRWDSEADLVNYLNVNKKNAQEK